MRALPDDIDFFAKAIRRWEADKSLADSTSESVQNRFDRRADNVITTVS